MHHPWHVKKNIVNKYNLRPAYYLQNKRIMFNFVRFKGGCI